MKRTKLKPLLSSVIAVLLGSLSLHAQTWTGGIGDYTDSSNWNPAAVPGAGQIATINNGGTAVISNNPTLSLGAYEINPGNLVMSNGTMSISDTLGDGDSSTGDGATLSTFIMYGGDIEFDDPAGAKSGKSGYLWPDEKSGLNHSSIAIGKGNPGNGRMELHGDAVIRDGSHVGLADAGTSTGQSGTLIMDGNSEFDLGDGIEVGKINSTCDIILSNNAKFVCGASYGIGNSSSESDDGSCTLGTRVSDVENVLIADHAELDCMCLLNRFGTVNILVTNYAKLQAFDLLNGSGTLYDANRTCQLAGKYTPGGGTTLTLADHATLYIDSDGLGGLPNPSAAVNGLSIGNCEYRIAVTGDYSDPATGGKGVLIVKDFATVNIVQGLHLGTYTSTNSEGTLRVIGPNATINIGGDLRLARNFLDQNTVGTGRVEDDITGPTQSVINVGGVAYLTNGVLKVVLQGYTPVPTDSWTLISGGTGGTIDGPFKTLDFSQAPAPAGYAWSVTYDDNTVKLSFVSALSITRSGDNITLKWGGTSALQSATDVSGPYVDVPGAASPYSTGITNATQFFRLAP